MQTEKLTLLQKSKQAASYVAAPTEECTTKNTPESPQTFNTCNLKRSQMYAVCLLYRFPEAGLENVHPVSPEPVGAERERRERVHQPSEGTSE